MSDLRFGYWVGCIAGIAITLFVLWMAGEIGQQKARLDRCAPAPEVCLLEGTAP